MKRCTKCGVEKPLTEFHRRAAVKDGRRADCKACVAERHRVYDKRVLLRPAPEPAPDSFKRCAKCGEAKPLDEFHRSKRARDGRHSQCKMCQSEYRRVWRQANKERIAERDRAYREANKERDVERKQVWREANREREVERQRTYRRANRTSINARNYARRRSIEPADAETVEYMEQLRQMPCAYCGTPGPSTIDHVIPVNRGGRNHWSNMVPACLSCNSAKCDRLLQDWYPLPSWCLPDTSPRSSVPSSLNWRPRMAVLTFR